MMPERYRFKESPEAPRANGAWITQVAIVLLVAAAFLAWQSPVYWAQRLTPIVHTR